MITSARVAKHILQNWFNHRTNIASLGLILFRLEAKSKDEQTEVNNTPKNLFEIKIDTPKIFWKIDSAYFFEIKIDTLRICEIKIDSA